LQTSEPAFRAEPFYNPYGDCIDYQTVDEAYFGDRVNSFITLYRSMKDRRAIGFLIKGVEHVLRNLGCQIVTIGTDQQPDGTISLVTIVFAAIQEAEEKASREQLDALGTLVPSMVDKTFPIRRAA